MTPTKLYLKRKIFTAKSTIGELYIEGNLFCYTLEDTVRKGPKVVGETAIPEGQYEVALNFSNSVGYLVPLLLNVSGFSRINIHVGNFPEDTKGCILVGNKKGGNSILESKDTFERLLTIIKEALNHGKVFIDIRN